MQPYKTLQCILINHKKPEKNLQESNTRNVLTLWKANCNNGYAMDALGMNFSKYSLSVVTQNENCSKYNDKKMVLTHRHLQQNQPLPLSKKAYFHHYVPLNSCHVSQ